MKQILAATFLTTGMMGLAQACEEAAHDPQNDNTPIVMEMIPHADIIPVESRSVIARGTIRTLEKGGSEPIVKPTGLRCASTTVSYEFIFNEESWNPADNKAHLTLDPNYDTVDGAQRGCVTVPVANLTLQPMTDFHGGKAGELRLFFNLDATPDQTARMKEFEQIVDRANRDNEYWCMTVKLDSLTLP